MESYTYTHFSDYLSIVHVALFTSVKNAADLRARIIRASRAESVEGDAERLAVNFAFIEAKLVTSRLHLQTAIFESMLAVVHGTLKTKTAHSEIIWCLNPTNNITEALRRFGLSDSSTSLLVVHVTHTLDRDVKIIESQMKAAVDGDLVSLDMLNDITDWEVVKKYYKLNGEPAVSALDKCRVRQNVLVNELVTSFVAMKGVTS